MNTEKIDFKREIQKLQKRGDERIALLRIRNWKSVDEFVENVNKNISFEDE